MNAEDKHSRITKDRADKIAQKAWELADCVLENDADPENDARLAVYSFLHALSRGDISARVVIGVDSLPLPCDSKEQTEQYEAAIKT